MTLYLYAFCRCPVSKQRNKQKRFALFLRRFKTVPIRSLRQPGIETTEEIKTFRVMQVRSNASKKPSSVTVFTAASGRDTAKNRIGTVQQRLQKAFLCHGFSPQLPVGTPQKPYRYCSATPPKSLPLEGKTGLVSEPDEVLSNLILNIKKPVQT